jgi:hypothetical protein
MSDYRRRDWVAPPPPGPGVPSRTPSGLFPARLRRPIYREPYPVRGGALAAGLGFGLAWLLVFGLLGRDLRGYGWWTAVAGGVAWLVAVGLGRLGDRGVAAGVAIATAFGWSVAATILAVRWAMTGDWPLW